MAQKPPSSVVVASEGHHENEPGTAVVATRWRGESGSRARTPAHYRPGPQKEKKAERRIALFFSLSIVGSLIAAISYIVFPIIPGDMQSVRLNNMFVGLGAAIGLLGVGIGAVNWAKSLMHGHELVEERHPTRGDEETRATAVEMFSQANRESGFTRRSLVRNTLLGALVATPIPAVVCSGT